MERKTILKTLLDILVKIKKTTYNIDEISEDFYLGGDLGISSIEMLETIYDIQKKLNISINDQDLVGLYTIKDALDLIERYLMVPSQHS